jgi:cell wall-associated NlpC family hydrolase
MAGVVVCALASTGAHAAVHQAKHPAATAAPAHAAAAAGGGSGPTATEFLHLEESKTGDPYVYGAIGPSEFDCSGLNFWALHQIGIDTGARTSEAQYAWTTRISYSQLEPGDLIFEQWPGDPDPSPGHVVTYVGGGRVVEAPHTGAYVQVRAWSPTETTIVGYGRIPGLRY